MLAASKSQCTSQLKNSLKEERLSIAPNGHIKGPRVAVDISIKAIPDLLGATTTWCVLRLHLSNQGHNHIKKVYNGGYFKHK